ncbi:MAG TPA: protease pro-enzyme activation domain-containing protein [Bryobacteraceae bacterium]
MRKTSAAAVLFFGTMALISAQDRIALRGNLHPKARGEFDLGRAEATLNIGYASLAFRKSAAQQTALDELLLEQQTPGAPNFHQWLTPEQFAERFAPSESSVAAAVEWLKSQGLMVHDVGRGRGFITFSGTAGQMETAFHTEIHRYRVNGETHFANSTEPSIPAMLAPMVGSVQGLNDFQMEPLGHMVPHATASDGSHSLAPDDLATIYDINRLYSAGLDGTGQSIAVIGQSDFDVTAVRSFRSKYNLAPRDPRVILYGNDPGTTGSSLETYLDLEWTGAVARNAQLIYVNSTNVFLSALYAIDNKLAPVMSFSYGYCEQQAPSGYSALFQALAQQANAQGITWVAAAGDQGATSCDNAEPQATKGAAVLFPASMPEVTAVGGSQFNEGTGTYWNAANGANGGSAYSYIPEAAWNESVLFGEPLGGGGGASVLFPKPVWQTGTGVPADSARDLPDVALTSSYHDSYNICVPGTCGSGIFGTSASAQAFAGMVALLNQYLSLNGLAQPGISGVGNLNPQLYRLAGLVPNAFHDITTGNNSVPCAAGTPNCVQGKVGFDAGAGYDLATGLGSVDAFNLVAGWTTAAARPATVTIPGASPSTFNLSDSTVLSATVVPLKGTGAADGSVSFYFAANLLGVAPLTTVAGQQTATLTVYGSQLLPGSDTILAIYNGSANFAMSSGTVPVTVSIPANSSAIIPSVSPNPVYQHTPDASGNTWTYTITLTNATKIATTLTDFTVDGVSLKSQLTTLFGGTAIPASGKLTAKQGASGLKLPYTRVLGFSGVDASGFTWTQQIPLTFEGPQFSSFISYAINAAAGQIAAAPGGLLEVVGLNLSAVPSGSGVVPKAPPLPTALAGVSATINDVATPLVEVAGTLVVLQVPYETPLGDTLLKLTTSSGQTDVFSIGVAPAAPGIFSSNSTGLMTPNGSGSRGKTYTLYITGDGAVSPALADGATPAASTPAAQLPKSVLPVSMTIGGVNAPIVFRGIPSGNVGVTQINFTVPLTAPLGVQQVVVRVGTISSPTAYFVVGN